MDRMRQFPSRGALRRVGLGPADLVVAAGVAALLYALVRVGSGLHAPFNPVTYPGRIPVDPADLPYDAARSLLRMFIGLAISVVFAFVYATAAARSRRAATVLLPILDILQSVPVLGFLSVTVTAFIALFPHSVLGLECASIFAIFTAMAWNMAFAFYQGLTTQPKELDEAARVMRLTRWERFWTLDVPSAAIPLVWNGMMSFGGAWFFLSASEAISVAGHTYALPGVGSYAASALATGNLAGVGEAIAVMILLVLGTNVLFWRPLVAWSERFRTEQSGSAETPRSAVLGVLRRSRIPSTLSRQLHPAREALDRGTRVFGLADWPLQVDLRRRRVGDLAFAAVVTAACAYGVYDALHYVSRTIGLGAFPHAFALGAVTFLRVVVIVVVSTLIWVPVGIAIGLSPRATRLAQPVVQVAASFPANLVYPAVVALLLVVHVGLDVGGVFLMALGAQWYVLFNVIAGASAVPSDLREAVNAFRLPRWERWKALYLPAVVPAYITGGITAAGGAWNASIVAEVVTFGRHHLVATGIGAYITEATARGDFPAVFVGVVVMSVYVVATNRLVWRRAYRLAEGRFSL
ncbi:ABC transporter permease subunit [Acidimicrobiaceae bacterium USS-CC1]|uniref:ABC transporter permease subunit n=1 Tax=Acidiferrimicrobium australe TaxID=2664430 RepID=A0ABW9QPS6_9ACTN|nr:ABC transporter permease subunit [Acidiferrimicrobium australe]